MISYPYIQNATFRRCDALASCFVPWYDVDCSVKGEREGEREETTIGPTPCGCTAGFPHALLTDIRSVSVVLSAGAAARGGRACGAVVNR